MVKKSKARRLRDAARDAEQWKLDRQFNDAACVIRKRKRVSHTPAENCKGVRVGKNIADPKKLAEFKQNSGAHRQNPFQGNNCRRTGIFSPYKDIKV